jgi:hypothetical protein
MKKTVLALALGLTIGSAGTAIAATSETVQAVFAKFNFVVNGESKQLATDPLVVDGTSYLPVREVAGLLGYQLEYDADSRTIKLDGGSKDGAQTTNKGDETMTTTVNADEWIAVRDFAQMNTTANVTVTTSGQDIYIVKGDLKTTFTVSDGSVMIMESTTYLKKEKLRSLGLLD